MYNFIKFVALIMGFLIINVSSSHASTQKYFLDENQKISGYISMSESNRIKVEGDRITEVIGLADGFAIESDEKLGQIFVKVTADDAKKAVFTIITEKGKTQDIKLVVNNKTDGQIIILQNKDIELTHNGKIIGNKHARHDEMVLLIKLGRGLEPELKKKSYLANNLEIILLNQKTSGKYTLEVWLIKNLADQPITLWEKLFITNNSKFQSPVAAIMIEQRELDSNESTKLYKVKYDG